MTTSFIAPEKYFPEHFFDPLRRRIAETYLRHELRKLFPNIRDDETWGRLDGEVGRWFQDNPTLWNVRDFWDAVDAFSCGIRLKEMASVLTSAHITWKEESVRVDDVSFGAILKGLEGPGQKRKASEVHAWFAAHPAERAAEQRVARGKTEQTAARDHFPIILLSRNGKTTVHDGNRRLLAAVVNDQSTIPAWHGVVTAEPALFEHWVPLSLLIKLTWTHRALPDTQTGTLRSALAQTIATLIRDSSLARTEFVYRCLNKAHDADVRLWQAVHEQLRFSQHSLPDLPEQPVY